MSQQEKKQKKEKLKKIPKNNDFYWTFKQFYDKIKQILYRKEDSYEIS